MMKYQNLLQQDINKKRLFYKEEEFMMMSYKDLFHEDDFIISPRYNIDIKGVKLLSGIKFGKL